VTLYRRNVTVPTLCLHTSQPEKGRDLEPGAEESPGAGTPAARTRGPFVTAMWVVLMVA
jgi:hypothetical protein